MNKKISIPLILALLLITWRIIDKQPPEKPQYLATTITDSSSPAKNTSPADTNYTGSQKTINPDNASNSLAIVQNSLAQIEALESCWLAGDCQMDYSDARADGLAATKALSQHVQSLTELLRKEPEFIDIIEPKLQQLITLADGHVQEAVIQTMAQLPTNPVSAQAIIRALSNTHDAPLLQQAMKELSRYPELASDIDLLMMETLKTGGIYASRSVAANIGQLLTNANLPAYEALSLQLPARSKKTKLLKQAINHFKLSDQGG